MSRVRRRSSEGEETLQDLWDGAVKVFCSWSGGKESCLACYKAMQEGHEVASLLTMVTTTGHYSRSHRLSKELLIAQSQALGIALHQRRVSWNTYERDFTKALNAFKQEGIGGGVFGALYLNEDRTWVERVCAEAGIVPLLPLWRIGEKDLLRTFIEEGFEAIVVAVRRDLVEEHWLGTKIDGKFIAHMKKRGIDVCGEYGEYHTLVVDGPIFSRRIEIRGTKITRRGKMAFLYVSGFTLGQKA